MKQSKGQYIEHCYRKNAIVTRCPALVIGYSSEHRFCKGCPFNTEPEKSLRSTCSLEMSHKEAERARLEAFCARVVQSLQRKFRNYDSVWASDRYFNLLYRNGWEGFFNPGDTCRDTNTEEGLRYGDGWK